MKLDIARLKELLSYSPETGDFTRVVPRGGCVAGSLAGTKNSDGYVLIRIDGVAHYAHQLAWLWMTGEWCPRIDHRDLNPSNNRWGNLRSATNSQNMANAEAHADSSSGLKGVTPHQGRFMARICGRYIGMYDTACEARSAYLTEAAVHFGEFAR